MPKTKRLRSKAELLKPEEKEKTLSRKKINTRAIISRMFEPPFVRQYRLFKKWNLF
jgi:hypothetical protein